VIPFPYKGTHIEAVSFYEEQKIDCIIYGKKAGPLMTLPHLQPIYVGATITYSNERVIRA
jgi:hypothetical protein